MLRTLVRLARKDNQAPRQPEPALLLARQNLQRGILGGLLMATVAIALWVYLALLFDKYYPWVSILLGVLIGLAVQRFGQGIDWRFPLAAALITTVSAAAGSFLVALFLTGREFGTGALGLVNEISTHTLRTFYFRDFGAVGVIYMLFAASLAAFYANRRLRPAEAVALRRLRESKAD